MKWPITTSNTINTPKSTGSRATTSGKSTWADMVEEETSKVRSIERPSEGVTWSRIVGTTSQIEGLDLSGEVNPSLNVKITREDIQEEVKYWETAVVCYALGSNLPSIVME